MLRSPSIALATTDGQWWVKNRRNNAPRSALSTLAAWGCAEGSEDGCEPVVVICVELAAKLVDPAEFGDSLSDVVVEGDRYSSPSTPGAERRKWRFALAT